jgi:L-galactose dehydrogenase/L-glyceraldehyde 3-phosphate reductase
MASWPTALRQAARASSPSASWPAAHSAARPQDIRSAAQSVAPIATSADLATDVAHAKRFEFLIAEGWVDDLPEAAIRFALSQPDITSALIGLSDLDQLERAIAAAQKGPLPQNALDRLPEVWTGLSV